MVSPLIRCQFAGAVIRTLSPGRHTWTRIGSDRIVLRIAAVATYAAFGGQDSGVPMLLGAAAFAALESDVYHHTLHACPPVEFAASSRSLSCEIPVKTLSLRRALSRHASAFPENASRAPPKCLLAFGTSREVKGVPQALQFPIIIEGS